MDGALPDAAGLLTQHGKEWLLAPVFRDQLGVYVHHVSGFDTDALGTFSGDVPRVGTQRDAARTKARLAIELSGLPAGLGSEGSFGADPVAGMVPWNRELLVWRDARSGMEVMGHAQGPARHAQAMVAHVDDVLAFAVAQDFPRHGCVLSARVGGERVHRKEVAGLAELEVEARGLLTRSDDARVQVETDLRAHRNPTRQAVIVQAAEDLMRRLRCACPACGSRGHGPVQAVPGLPCGWCEAPTQVARADRWECPACRHSETRLRTGIASADPAQCDRCNP